MIVDLLYVSYNRLEYTRASFEALLKHTDWSLVRRLYVADDESTDGSRDFLLDAIADAPVPRVMTGGRFGGPVAAMNWYLEYESTCEACDGTGFKGGELYGDICLACNGSGEEKHPDVFAKIDNDFVVCPGWLNELTRVLAAHPELDVLGMEPFTASETNPPAMPPFAGRSITGMVEHVGGKGLIRRRVFSHCRPVPGGFNGYQGWTQYQTMHPEVSKAWVTPDLPCFGLDQIRDEDSDHWRALARGYEAEGLQRLWPEYGGSEHYAWWLES